MRVLDYDIGIVGAGFAGLACARVAARRGLRVLVIDRKPGAGVGMHTTGLVVKEAAERWEIPATLTRRVPGIRLYAPSLAHTDLVAAGYYFLATDTPALMRWLAREAARAGAHLRFAQPCRQRACARASASRSGPWRRGCAFSSAPTVRARAWRARSGSGATRDSSVAWKASSAASKRGRRSAALLSRRQARAGLYRLGGAGGGRDRADRPRLPATATRGPGRVHLPRWRRVFDLRGARAHRHARRAHSGGRARWRRWPRGTCCWWATRRDSCRRCRQAASTPRWNRVRPPRTPWRIICSKAVPTRPA